MRSEEITQEKKIGHTKAGVIVMVISIDVAVAMDIDVGMTSARLVDFDRGNLLLVTLSYGYRKRKSFSLVVTVLGYFNVVDITVLIEVEIIDALIRIVQEPFKLLRVTCFAQK